MTMRVSDSSDQHLSHDSREGFGGSRSRQRRAVSVGAFALGALALGAVAIGAVAIGRLAIGRARIKRLEIDELVVRQLRVIDEIEAPKKPGPES